MAPQATLVVPTPTAQSSVLPPSAPANDSHKPFIPVTLLVFLGLCLAYTLSYVLYRIIMSRRRESEGDIPDSPDRGVSQFMNGARLTLNLGHNQKSTPVTLSESPDMLDEDKLLADSSHPAHPEIPISSPADSSSTPFISLTPTFTMHPDQVLCEAQFQEQGGPTEPQASVSAPSPVPTQQPFSQRVADEVKLLSTDRAEAIVLDPKLAPVQIPLRPLSMVPSPSRKKRMTLFGLGLKHARGHGGDRETNSETQ
ncbi:hypothetical protein J3R82DRAFT_3775 [Butyriboletus roseoflavus]|nr:hypothetical protein J3R82DRAFT_3775 [Butyriboletus roseoflavus]